MNKQKELDKIKKAIESCEECKKDKTGVIVFGEGNLDAKIMFVGEAPGKQEAVTGHPFIGRSGKLLRATIRSVGLNEEDVYITSPVKYLPLSGTPSQADIDHARPYFFKQVSIINPQIIVLLGSTAVKAALGEQRSVLKDHGTILEREGRKYLLTIHPAAVLRFNKYKTIFEEDFQKLKKLITV